jgi:2-desacetyl-2-hydroxyethyl bacteriochlorophyllide A dehydrogenase
MKAAYIEQAITDFSQVKFKNDFAVPQAKAGHAVVKVVAASVNPVDKLVTFGYMGGFGWPLPSPHVPGYDFAGVVQEVGEGVSNVAVGDEVFASHWGQGSHHDAADAPIAGAFAEYLLIPAHKLSKKPAAVSFEVASAIGIVGTTAYEALFDIGHINGESKVLILGGSSAVGLLAIQFAKIAGAHVATTASSRTVDFVQSLGADIVINYNEKQWHEELRDYDLVFDCVGEAKALDNAMQSGAVNRDGKFITIVSFDIGLDPAGHPPLSFGAAICFKQNTASQNQIAEWIAAGKVRLPIDETFPFTQDGITNLLNKVAGGKSVGKNVVRIA